MKSAASILLAAAALASARADPPPSTTNWTIIAHNVASFSFGVAFINESYGYLPGDQNGKGAEVLITTDGGYTWNYNEGTGFALAFTDVRAINETVMVTSLLTGEHHSSDYGETFTDSKGGGLSQCARLVGPREKPIGYGVAGQVDDLTKQGVATSLDGGATFQNAVASHLDDNAQARYAAFPTTKRFFLASGVFPTNNDDQPTTTAMLDEEFTRVRGRVGIRRNPDGTTSTGIQTTAPNTDDGTTDPWFAEMSRTDDGGQTWKTLFTNSSFYFNSIACHTPDECCVVGEADSGSDPGARIYCTSDGTNFERTLFLADPEESLLDIAAVGDSTYWAVGGHLVSQFDITGKVWLSQDSGKTWSLAAEIPKNYLTSIDCLSIDKCWATTANELNLASVAALVA